MANYKRSSHVLTKQAGEELVLLHSITGNYYTLNSLGKKIWEFCASPKNEEEILNFISGENDASIETCKADIAAYLASLTAENIFEKY